MVLLMKGTVMYFILQGNITFSRNKNRTDERKERQIFPYNNHEDTQGK